MADFRSAVEVLQSYIEKKNICGAYIKVRRHGDLVLDQGIGVIDPKDGTPVDENTIFMLASMTKPILAAAAMQLTEEGSLRLEDRISRFLPGYDTEDGKGEITVLHLLNHSCGLGMIGMPGMLQGVDLMEREDRLRHRVDRFAALIPDFPAGSAAGYSPYTGFDILGRILELIEGKKLDQILEDRIFSPLGMTDTGFLLTAEQKARRSVLFHDENFRPDVPLPSDFEKLEWGADASVGGYFSGSAGLLGSARDYDRIAQMYRNEGEVDGVRILKKETVRLMRTPTNDFEMKPDVRWGIGMEVFGDPELSGVFVHPGSFGWSGAYGSHFYVDVEADISCVLMLNADGLGGSESFISRAVEKAIYDAAEASM